MQALEARYKSLEISYEKLSESNRKLVDAHVALTQSLCATTSSGPFSATTKSGSTQLSAQPIVTDLVTCHLQRCIDTVEELTRTITCAIGVWRGHGKYGSSDLLGSYATVATAFNQIAAGLKCSACTDHVLWADFNPTEPHHGCGTCICTIPSWKALGVCNVPAPAATNVGLNVPDLPDAVAWHSTHASMFASGECSSDYSTIPDGLNAPIALTPSRHHADVRIKPRAHICLECGMSFRYPKDLRYVYDSTTPDVILMRAQATHRSCPCFEPEVPVSGAGMPTSFR